MINKDAIYEFPSGKKKVVLKEGTFYVRHSAGNHLADAQDLSNIIQRRLNQFKGNLLEGISRVVEAPPSSEVVILSQDETNGQGTSFIIHDAPDSLPVKGMSFSVTPETAEQEIAGWDSLYRGNQDSLPTPRILWKWYRDRGEIRVTEEYRIAVARFSIFNSTPAMFWLSGCRLKSVKSLLIDTSKAINSVGQASYISQLAMFYGELCNFLSVKVSQPSCP